MDERGDRVNAEALGPGGPPDADDLGGPDEPAGPNEPDGPGLPPAGTLPDGALPDASAPPVDPAAIPSSAWISSPPPPRGRSLLSTIATIGAVLIGLVVIAAVIGLNSGYFLPRGQILFGTAAGADLCSVSGETRTVTRTDPVFFAAILKHRMAGSEAIRLTVTRDGLPFFDNEEPADGTEFECYGSRESIGPLEHGVYVFTITHNDDVEATGTLTVT